jgi:cytochrome c-type biogenesis protein CcmE
MTHRYIKIAVTSVVLVLAFGGLLWSTLRDGTEYYKHVDEVMTSPQAWEGKRLQLHGYVVADSILRKRDSLEYKFKVQNKGSVVDATYTGIVPDTFKDNAEVVLKGRLGPDGFHVDPNGVMAKCPSKYESAKSAAAGS